MNEYLTHQERKAIHRKKISLWAGSAVVLFGSVFGIYQLNQLDQRLVLDNDPVVSEHNIGPDAAKVKLVEYADFQCPACRAFHPLIEQIIKDFGDQVQFSYRYLPLKTVHVNAMSSAYAAEAASKQNMFWEMHDKLFETQNSWANAHNAEELYMGYAKELGLDDQKFQSDMHSSEVRAVVEKSYQEAEAQGLGSTPSIFINDKKISFANYQQLKTLIKNELEK